MSWSRRIPARVPQKRLSSRRWRFSASPRLAGAAVEEAFDERVEFAGLGTPPLFDFMQLRSELATVHEDGHDSTRPSGTQYHCARASA